MKLKLKLPLMVFALMSASTIAVSVILLVQASAIARRSAEYTLTNMDGLYAAKLNSIYENYLNAPKALADIMNTYLDVPAEERRERYDITMEGIMKSEPNFVGIFALWKPNILDGNDAAYVNTEASDSTGRYMSWYTRRSGRLERLPLSQYERYNEIVANLDNADPVFNNPYFVNMNGKQTLLARLCYPVIINGRIMGRVGIIFDLTESSTFIKEIQPFGTGRAVVYSNNGTIAAHYDSSMVGKNIRDPASLSILGEQVASAIEVSLRTGQPYLGYGDDRLFESCPLKLLGYSSFQLRRQRCSPQRIV